MMAQATQALDCEALLRRGAEILRNGGIESPRREARLLLAQALGVSAHELITMRLAVPERSADAFAEMLARRSKREPLAYITGSREFWSMNFIVAPGVLIPRPESETLVEAALREFPQHDAAPRVLDLGTGSGCLLLAFLSERPGASGLGIDISETALSIATRNASVLSLDQRAAFRRSDWTRDVSGQFDLVLANPPYISRRELPQLAPEIVQFEPAKALDGGADGLDAYRSIAAGLPAVLSSGGKMFLECGEGQVSLVQEIFTSRGLVYHGTGFDLAGTPRCLIMRA
jgi:release factor glutamine methyltransferase